MGRALDCKYGACVDNGTVYGACVDSDTVLTDVCNMYCFMQ